VNRPDWRGNVDQERYDALMAKSSGAGLSDEEANELGRLMAEKEGRTYGGATEREQELLEVEDEETKERRDKRRGPVQNRNEIFDKDTQKEGFLPSAG
jgi:hypothetical protein